MIINKPKSPFRHTDARRWILRTVKAAVKPLTAEQVLVSVKKHYPTVNLTTTYRNLGWLAIRGEIYVIEGIDGIKRYIGHSFHEQTFRCQRCGKVQKLALEDLVDAVKYRLRKQPVFYSRLMVVGWCKRCCLLGK